jgi:hypothetical protein
MEHLEISNKPKNLGVIAQNYARKELIRRHRAEWEEIYRAEMIRLGGKPKPTIAEKIDALRGQIAQLETEQQQERERQ